MPMSNKITQAKEDINYKIILRHIQVHGSIAVYPPVISDDELID